MRSTFLSLPAGLLGLSMLAACGGASHHRTVDAGSVAAPAATPGAVAAGGEAPAAAGVSPAAQHRAGAVAQTPATAPARPTPPTTASGAGTGGSSGAAAADPSPVSAAADQVCVHPGETQGVTVRGEPGGTVVFDTVYADHTDNLTTKYGSGSGNGKADGSGVFHMTWTLAPNVPAGPATINVGATYHRDLARAATTFLVKPAGEPC